MRPLLETTPPSNFRRVDELTWSELEALDRSRTVCVCAVSALEVHGPHLPVGSDFHQAAWVSDETGRRFAGRHPDWTVLRYPPLPLGTDELPLPGSIDTRPRTVYDAVCALGRSLARARFRYVMLTNAHGGPRHAAALEAACRRVSKRSGIAMFTPSIRALHRLVSGQAMKDVEEIIGRDLTASERHGLVSGEHAGTWETSWYLAQRPELVGAGYPELAEDHPPKFGPLAALGRRLTREGSGDANGKLGLGQVLDSLAGSIGWLLNARWGYGRRGARVSYSGWPGVAAADIGRAFSELPVRSCLEDLEAVTEGRLDPLQVKSIASDPIIIQPYFFRAVLGVLGLLALAAIWLLL